jgi:hypothetical protein
LSGATRFAYRNGTAVTSFEGMTFIAWPNCDFQQESLDGASCYRYACNGAVELRFPEGSVYLQFADGQREQHSISGEKRIIGKDGRAVAIAADGKCVAAGRKARRKGTGRPTPTCEAPSPF